MVHLVRYAGIVSTIILVLFLTGNLALWHLYLLAVFSGVFDAFQFPAFAASMTTMLSKEHYGRANGLLSVAESTAQVAGPVLAAFLIALVGIGGVLVLDIITFIVALALLAPLIVPQPKPTADGAAGKGSLRHEVIYGFRYILARPGLLGLRVTFLGINLVEMMLFSLVSPTILARTGGNEHILGVVLGGAGLGGVAGGVLMSIWGGPRRRIHGVLLGMAGVMALGQIPFGLVQTQLLWTLTLFAASFCGPIMNASSQAIWQAKVAPDVQGRVFATRRSPVARWLVCWWLGRSPTLCLSRQCSPVARWLVCWAAHRHQTSATPLTHEHPCRTL